MIQCASLLVINKSETAENIKRLMRENAVTPRELQPFLGLANVQSVYHWLSGRSLPSIDNLVLLSHLWNIPINDILRCNEIEYYQSIT